MGLLDFMAKLRERSGQPPVKEIRPRDELLEAVDLVVKLSHPNIHYVHNYRKKLMPAVEHTLKYGDELMAMIPAPVLVESDSWDTDPFMKAAFAGEEQFTHFFSGNKTLKSFFQKTNAPRCHALLVMNRTNKKVLGAELDGEIIRRDVLQTRIDFSDPRIVAPMISEAETRKELSLRALSLLATHTLEDILSLIERKKELELEKQVLEVKLQIKEARFQSRSALLPDASDETSCAIELLGQLDRKIAEVRTEIDEPEDYLNKVTELLYHPEQFLKYEPVRLLVNDMNIIVENGHQGRIEEIRFAEFSTRAGFRKASVLVNCARF